MMKVKLEHAEPGVKGKGNDCLQFQLVENFLFYAKEVLHLQKMQ